MEYLKVKNWKNFQHYKHRNPPWIKLHVQLLNDKKFTSLSSACKCLLMLAWILAAEKEGQIPFDMDELKFRLRDSRIKLTDLNILIDKGFLRPCKQVLASAYKVSTEAEAETETECSEQKQVSCSKPEPVTFCFLTSKFLSVKPTDLSRWRLAYPAVDIDAAILQAAEWLASNPKKRKVNYRRFLTNWFARSQERGGSLQSNKAEQHILGV